MWVALIGILSEDHFWSGGAGFPLIAPSRVCITAGVPKLHSREMRERSPGENCIARGKGGLAGVKRRNQFG